MKTIRNILRFAGYGCLLVAAAGCATSSKNESASSSADAGKVEASSSSRSSRSGGDGLFTESLSNNGMTSLRYDLGKAKGAAGNKARASSPAELEELLAAQRLARMPSSTLLNTARKLAASTTKKGAAKELPESVRLDLALGAMVVKDYALANLFLNELAGSKDPNIKAAVFNAYGVEELLVDRVPEAVEMWKKALSAKSNYKPAAYNLAFLALQGGDINTARTLLLNFSEDWFAEAGLFVADRNLNSTNNLDSKCERLIKDHGSNRMVIFNCGLYEGQNRGDIAKARQLINKSKGLGGGAPHWNERANKVMRDLAAIEEKDKANKQQAAQAKAQQQAEAAKAKAKAAAPAAAAPKGKAPATGAAPAAKPAKK